MKNVPRTRRPPTSLAALTATVAIIAMFILTPSWSVANPTTVRADAISIDYHDTAVLWSGHVHLANYAHYTRRCDEQPAHPGESTEMMKSSNQPVDPDWLIWVMLQRSTLKTVSKKQRRRAMGAAEVQSQR